SARNPRRARSPHPPARARQPGRSPGVPIVNAVDEPLAVIVVGPAPGRRHVAGSMRREDVIKLVALLELAVGARYRRQVRPERGSHPRIVPPLTLEPPPPSGLPPTDAPPPLAQPTGGH